MNVTLEAQDVNPSLIRQLDVIDRGRPYLCMGTFTEQAFQKWGDNFFFSRPNSFWTEINAQASFYCRLGQRFLFAFLIKLAFNHPIHGIFLY